MSRSERPKSVLRSQALATRRGGPNALVGSALLLSGPGAQSVGRREQGSDSWHGEAWDLWDDVGEMRAGVQWLCNAASRVNLTVARVPVQPGDKPEPADPDDPDAQEFIELLNLFGGGPSGHSRIMHDLTLHLSVPGIGYVYAPVDPDSGQFRGWWVLPRDSVTLMGGDRYTITDPVTGDPNQEIGPDDILMEVWRSHPHYPWMPDSPIRAALPVLRELKALSARATVEANSRLLGNGIIWMPREAEFTTVAADDPLLAAANSLRADGDPPNSFMQMLAMHAQRAYADPMNPVAGNPLVARVPSELIANIRHDTFWSPIDEKLDEMRDSATRRLSLVLDMPPEMLLGLGESNHWNGWLIAEGAIGFHVEPMAELISHAITTDYLRRASDNPNADQWMVWPDTSDLRTRPDLSDAAAQAHALDLITDEAYLSEVGLDAHQRPDDLEFKRRQLVRLAQAIPQLAPSLLYFAGVLTETQAQGLVVTGESTTPTSDVDATVPDDDGVQSERRDPPDRDNADDGRTAALLAAADVMVVRALEKSGNRLRSAIGKNTPGGSEAVECPDPTTLHVERPATHFASLDFLLDGVWDRVPPVAARYGVEPDSLVAVLDSYTKALIASAGVHDYDALRMALCGVHRGRPSR